MNHNEPTLIAAAPDLLAALQTIQEALHNGPDADGDGDVVRAVRDRKGDYLTMLTDLGDIAAAAIAKAETH